MKRTVLGLVVAVSLAACTKEVPRVHKGSAAAKGEVVGLYRSPDGTQVATLVGAQPVREPGAPTGIVAGALHLAPVAGGESRRLGGGVTNLPDSLLFSPDSKWLAFLASYSVPRALGELRLAQVGGKGEPESLAEGVTFYAFSGDGQHLAWVSDGRAYVRSVSGGEVASVTDGVATVSFGPAGTASAGTLYIKRSLKHGGALLAWDVAAKKLSAIARGTRAFTVAPNGHLAFQAEALLPADETAAESVLGRKEATGEPGLYLATGGAPKRISEEVASEFRFSPDGTKLAFVTPPALGSSTGDLHLYDGEKTQKVAPRVASFQFTPDGAIVLLGAWEPRSSAGTLGVRSAAGELREVARTVKQFKLSPNAKYVLFSQMVPVNGMWSLGLAVQPVAAPKDAEPRLIDTGVFGYVVDEREQRIAYKADCVENGKACTLFTAALEGSAAPVELAKRVTAFEFVPGTSDIAAVFSRPAGKHTGNLFYSLSIVPGDKAGEARLLDDHVTGEFLVAKDRLAWLVNEEGREGLYVAPVGAAVPVSQVK